MRRAAVFLMLLLFMRAECYAQAAPATLCVVPTPPANTQQYIIDLINGGVNGKRRFKTQDEVQIVLKNKNPFLFAYDIQIKEETVAEPALDTFLALFQNVPMTAIPLPSPQVATPSASTGGGPQAGADANSCTSRVNDAIRQLATREQILLASFGSLKVQADNISSALNQLKTNIGAQEKVLTDSAQDCGSLVRAAQALTSVIATAFPQPSGGIGAQIDQFEQSILSFRSDVQQATVLPQTLRTGLEAAGCTGTEIDRFQTQASKFSDTLDTFKGSLRPNNEQGLAKAEADFQKAEKDALAKGKGVDAVLQRPENFLESRLVGDYDDVTDVKITIKRKKADEASFPDSPYLAKTIRFGGRVRFAIAAGAAFTSLDNIDYGAVQGIERDIEGKIVVKDGKPVLTRVVGTLDEADQRVPPVIALHTRIAPGKGLISGVHLTLGFAGNMANNGVNLEYLTGVSISFAEERFFLTLGGYNGRTEKLRDGFYEGLALPETFTEDPVKRDRDWNLGFSLTYKFR